MATIDDSAKSADAASDGVLGRYPLFFFFLLSFVLTWGYFWLIWAPLGLPDSLIALGGFGPAVSAFPGARYDLREARGASLVTQYHALAKSARNGT